MALTSELTSDSTSDSTCDSTCDSHSDLASESTREAVAAYCYPLRKYVKRRAPTVTEIVTNPLVTQQIVT